MDLEKQKPEKKITIEPPKSILGDSRIGKLLKVEDSPSSGVELLSAIFKLMVRAEEFDKLQRELNNNQLSIRKNREIERNNELIKALTARRPKKPEAVERPSLELPRGKKPTLPKIPKAKKPSGKAPTAPKVPSSVIPPIITGGAVIGGLLPLLAKGESSDYNQLVNPQKGSNKPSKAPLTTMTLNEVREYQKTKMGSKNGYPSDAVGRYQIIGSTLDEAIDALGLDKNAPFDKDMQDRIYKQYLISKKRPAIEDFIAGKSDDIGAAQMSLAQEFASFGVPYRIWRPERKDKHGKVIWDARWIEKGQSYYTGSADNRANITPEESAVALQEERHHRLNGNSSTYIPGTVTVSGADRIYNSSNENQQLNEQLNNQHQTNIVNNNIVNQNSSSETNESSQSHDDRPAFLKKAQ